MRCPSVISLQHPRPQLSACTSLDPPHAHTSTNAHVPTCPPDGIGNRSQARAKRTLMRSSKLSTALPEQCLIRCHPNSRKWVRTVMCLGKALVHTPQQAITNACALIIAHQQIPVDSATIAVLVRHGGCCAMSFSPMPSRGKLSVQPP